MGIRTFLFFILISLCIGSSAAEFHFTNIGVLQGLSSATVNCIFTDSRGFTWIGTNSGLNRFDGESFILYAPHRSDSTTLPGENISSIAEDSSGLLWIGTENGIAKFNPWNGKSEKIQQVHGTGIDNSNCKGVLIDHNQNIWGRSIDGVWKYDATSNKFLEALSCNGNNNHPRRCENIYEDHQNRFWICSYDGIYNFDRATKQLKHYQISEEENIITSIFQDHANNLWCSTWGNGIVAFYPETNKFVCKKWIENPANPSATNLSFSFTETKEENHFSLWAATNQGLALITKKPDGNIELTFAQHNSGNPESILSDQINFLSENERQLWVGTSDGISILLPERQVFQDFTSEFKGQNSHIYQDQNGTTFFCSWYGNGLQQLDEHGKLIRAWKTVPENNTSLDCGQISDVTRGKDGSLWVAAFGGLAHGDAEGNSFKQILPDTKKPNSICDRHITCVAVDHSGFIWCGSYGKGISKLDPNTDECVNYGIPNEKDNGLPSSLIWSLLCDKSGKIWVGTNFGISTFNEKENHFDSWKFVIRDNDTLWVGVCSTLFEDKQGRIWFGTDNGLFLKKLDNSFTVFLKEDGLADNHVRGIREDKAGNIWISTSNGLSKFDPRTGIFTKFSLGNGLPVSNLEGDMGTMKDGRICIGLNNRVVVFRPEQLKVNSTAGIFITSISVSGKTFSLDKNPSLVPETEFPWNDNVINFDFVAPGFRGNSIVKYEIQLVGVDQTWVNSDTRHFASYVGLPPGSYTFLCRASVNNGNWSRPAHFSFIIHPPVWKRWWFIGGVTLITLVLIILIVRRETARKFREKILILEKKQAVELERNRISRDMHDDLGSGLTKIAILSEVVKKKITHNDDSQKQVNIISESARELVDNLNEIIWALNPENDNITNLAAYIREYADRFLEPFDIHSHCNIPEELPPLHLSEEKRRNIFLVVKEALHNIVKHAQAKKVELTFRQNGHFAIEIRDDGIGFDESEIRQFGNGLASMKKRAEAIGATFIVTSEKGKGATIRIELP